MHEAESAPGARQKGVLARVMRVLGKESTSGEPPYKTKLYSSGLGNPRVIVGDRRPISLGGSGVTLSRHTQEEDT